MSNSARTGRRPAATRLNRSEIDGCIDDSAACMRRVVDAIAVQRSEADPVSAPTSATDTTLPEVLAAAAAFDARAARADVARFQTIYRDIPILPPDQYSSLVLAATDGCRYNQCTFCGFYRDMQFHAKSVAEFQAHVQAAMAYHGHGLALRRGIFLGQADALWGPRAWPRTSPHRESSVRIAASRCDRVLTSLVAGVSDAIHRHCFLPRCVCGSSH